MQYNIYLTDKNSFKHVIFKQVYFNGLIMYYMILCKKG